MPVVSEIAVRCLCNILIGPFWANVKLQTRVEKIIIFLCHQTTIHWSFVLDILGDMSESIVCNVENDMQILFDKLTSISVEFEEQEKLSPEVVKSDIPKIDIVRKLDDIQCPASALKLLLISRLLVQCNDTAIKTIRIKADSRNTPADEESESITKDTLRFIFAPVARSSVWIQLQDCLTLLQSICTLTEYKFSSKKMPHEINSFADLTDMFSPNPKEKVISNSPTDIVTSSSKSIASNSMNQHEVIEDDNVPAHLTRLFPLVEAYCLIFGTCMFTPSSLLLQSEKTTRDPKVADRPSSVRQDSISSPLRNFLRSSSVRETMTDNTIVPSTPIPLMREFSVPDSKFKSARSTFGSTFGRSMSIRLDPEGFDRLLQNPNLSNDSQTVLQLSENPKRRSSAADFLQFVEKQAPLLNALLSHDIRLLESSLSVLQLVPDCKKQLRFALKKKYFDLTVRRLRREATKMDSERSGRPQDIATYLATYHSSIIRARAGPQEHISNEQVIYVEVDRSNILESSYQALISVTPSELLAGQFDVTFVDEEGVDGGGLTREWLSLLTRELFKPQYALFIRSSDGGPAYQPNPQSGIANPNHL
jgi:hypothetical protein